MTGAIEQQVSEAVRFAVNDAVRPIAQKLDTLYSIEAKRMMNKADAAEYMCVTHVLQPQRHRHCTANGLNTTCCSATSKD